MDLQPNPFATPTTPAARLKMAADLAADTMVARHMTHRQQTGESPVLVVAIADAEIGRQFIVGHYGLKILYALTGPVVIAQSMAQFLGQFGEVDREAMRARFADAPEGAMLVCFAVNGNSLEWRIGSPAPSREELPLVGDGEAVAA